MSVRVRIALTIFITGALTAIGVMATVLFAFQRFEHETTFQRADASAVTPFTYAQLVWATLVGWIAFGAFPPFWTLIGMLVIMASGLFITLYEQRRARTSAGAAAPTTVD